MPICHLETNFPESFFPDGFEDDLAKYYSELVGRPIDRIFVCIVPNKRLRIRDSPDGGILFRMGGLNVYKEAAKRREYGLAVAKYVHDKLNIPLDRMVMDVRAIDIKELAMSKPIY